MKIQHRVKYKEIHGEDEIVEMDFAEHRKLHAELRTKGVVKQSVEELAYIADKAHQRTEKRKNYFKKKRKNNIQFIEKLAPGIWLYEQIRYFEEVGLVVFNSWFKSNECYETWEDCLQPPPRRRPSKIRKNPYKTYRHEMNPDLEVLIPANEVSYLFKKDGWDIVDGEKTIKLIKK